MTNPFDAAIAALESIKHKALVLMDGTEVEPGWAEPAIRFLEAARKVDKRAIDFFLCEAIEPREYEISSQDLPSKYSVGKRGVEILCTALPDRPAKEKA
jgi:hypothetical protein